MARTRRISTTVALIVCLVCTHFSHTLFANEDESPSGDPPSAQSVATSAPENVRVTFSDDVLFASAPVAADSRPFAGSALKLAVPEWNAFAQRGRDRGRGRGRGSRGGSNGGATAAIVLGAVASIAGAAVLVYANRPDCRGNAGASGCGYGTKVLGGAVLTAGVFGFVAGALTWR